MASDVVEMKLNAETLMGVIQEQEFAIKSDSVGPITEKQADIAWIIFNLYGDEDGDQMMLHGNEQYTGTVLNQSIHIKLDSNGQILEVPTNKIRAIMFDTVDP